MRWLLAALCFAMTTGLAVATAAVQASNVALRLRLHAVERRVVAHVIERARHEHVARLGASRVELARHWRRFCAAAAHQRAGEPPAGLVQADDLRADGLRADGLRAGGSRADQLQPDQLQ